MKEGDSIVGKHLLVGLTYLDNNGQVKKQLQLHGTILEISETTVIFERADGGGTFSIPFDGEFESANPEDLYTLSSTGEEVRGVELLSSWTISAPKNDKE